MNNSKVSIIIPTYNQENFLEKTISSALRQDYSNFEVVVSDDCSTADITHIINKFNPDTRFKYFRNERNIGRVANYHRALYKYASGDYAVNLDGDDYYIDETFISEAIKLIEQNTDVSKPVLFYKALQTKNKDFEVKVGVGKAAQAISTPQYLKYFKRYGLSHLSTLYNRKLALTVPFYVNDILSTDIDSILRMCLKYKNSVVIIHDKIVGVWNMHLSNTSNNPEWKHIWPSLKIYFTTAKNAKKEKINLPLIWPVHQCIKHILKYAIKKSKVALLGKQSGTESALLMNRSYIDD